MIWAMICTASALLAFDLEGIRSEPNPERRSDRAMINAQVTLDGARDAYRKGDVPKAAIALEEVRESVDLGYEALVDGGKDPHKHPKFFKAAELKTRDMLRRLNDMYREVAQEDRVIVEKVRDSVSEVHDNLLNGIMTRKKKPKP